MDYPGSNTVFYSAGVREDLKYAKTMPVWGFE